MEQKDFADALSECLDDEACQQVLGDEARIAQAPETPMNNFFGDDLFALLYLREGPCSRSLARIRESLEEVSNQKLSRHLRADAALVLGHFVLSRHSKVDLYARGVSHPIDWFRLARQLGSVIGGLAYANALLAEANQSVEFSLEKDPLPRLVWDSKSEASAPSPSDRVCEAWCMGARVALRHVQRDFTGWGAEAFGCALACVVNYLTLLPQQQKLTGVSPLPQRRAALAWLKPLWNRLIVAAPEHALDPQAYRMALVEQQLAVFMRLDDLEQGRGDYVRAPVAVDSLASEGGQIIVIRGEIPDTSDRSEKDYLKRYEVLRRPVALTSLPDLTGLEAIRRALEAEFPWAIEAIGTVMSDLLARRRHGAVRLGLSPILLAGLPGTGKTRFAQRLSDLLGTPNTVINLAGMADVKVLKGVARGWASNRPSRMLEFIQQTRVANPLFVLDEIDKARGGHSNGGDPQEAMLDLLEPGNAKRYQDIYLMAECDLSYCLYIATSNSLEKVPEPLLSRLRPVYFPPPGPEHTESIVQGMLADLARNWGLPEGTLTVTPHQVALMRGLAPRELRRALLDLFGSEANGAVYTLH